jgi:HSF-type DNA-binding
MDCSKQQESGKMMEFDNDTRSRNNDHATIQQQENGDLMVFEQNNYRTSPYTSVVCNKRYRNKVHATIPIENRSIDDTFQSNYQLKQEATVTIELDGARTAKKAKSNGEDIDRKKAHCVYADYSTDLDSDLFTPVTPVGHVPNFPAKLHAILCRADFSDIICWMPHGRSWRVQNPVEFERSVIALYFSHCTFASFQRQVNVWGFRRITSVDSYCHPLFLRGLTHLCKKMKRGDPLRESRSAFDDVDLYKFSEQYPVPEGYTDDSVLLPCVLHGGPKARMTLMAGSLKAPTPKLSDFVPKTRPSDSRMLASPSLSIHSAIESGHKEYHVQQAKQVVGSSGDMHGRNVLAREELLGRGLHLDKFMDQPQDRLQSKHSMVTIMSNQTSAVAPGGAPSRSVSSVLGPNDGSTSLPDKMNTLANVSASVSHFPHNFPLTSMLSRTTQSHLQHQSQCSYRNEVENDAKSYGASEDVAESVPSQVSAVAPQLSNSAALSIFAAGFALASAVMNQLNEQG